MRHRKRNNHLKRKSSHRKSMLANMSCSLIQHKRIKTTLAKAKELKKFVEPIINRSKIDSTHNRRITFRYLRQKQLVTELFTVVSDKVADRNGGYTRIIKLGTRLGDSAEMCFIELVDFNETYQTKIKSKRTRRSRRSDKQDTKSILTDETGSLDNTPSSTEEKPSSTEEKPSSTEEKPSSTE
ncbi:MAG: 50S ribosomal protein L17, partial [Flavobacteriales bacterium]|nr:50S ribosomal protein L17 [Flavobacteriales bacterium]